MCTTMTSCVQDYVLTGAVSTQRGALFLILTKVPHKLMVAGRARTGSCPCVMPLSLSIPTCPCSALRGPCGLTPSNPSPWFFAHWVWPVGGPLWDPKAGGDRDWVFLVLACQPRGSNSAHCCSHVGASTAIVCFPNPACTSICLASLKSLYLILWKNSVSCGDPDYYWGSVCVWKRVCLCVLGHKMNVFLTMGYNKK